MKQLQISGTGFGVAEFSNRCVLQLLPYSQRQLRQHRRHLLVLLGGVAVTGVALQTALVHTGCDGGETKHGEGNVPAPVGNACNVVPLIPKLPRSAQYLECCLECL
jgi:hypothetical protein